ncbi:MAG TPA: energy transducer TonB [Thermoanaerobaculia bacterium]|nr:energy transducer TonB [Thermoanaerobaculia bacterium]
MRLPRAGTSARRGQRIAAAFLLVLAIAACRAENAYAPDRWWIDSCGDIQPLGVGHDVTPPILIERVEPQWPRDKTRGVIIIETVLTDEGRVCAARVLRGLGEPVDAAALDAVRRWRFTPAELRGQPRAARFTVSLAVN